MEKKNEFDKKVRKLLKREERPIPESYTERLKSVLSELPKSSMPKEARCFNWKAAVAMLVVVLIASTPVAVAGVRAYIAHLNEMEPEHVEEIGDAIQNSQGEADVYSRELLPAEQERMTELRDIYTDGKSFPEQELKQIKTEAERQTGEFCFCYENSTFYLPETEMSEEQLRQIVDFQYRRDYALEKGQEAEAVSDVEEEEEPAPTEVTGSEKEAFAQQAAGILEKLYGVDVSGAECNVKKGDDSITAYYENTDLGDIQVKMDADRQIVLDVVFLREDEETEEKIPVDEEEYRRQGKSIRKMAEALVPSEEIKDVVMQYDYTADETLEWGSVTYYAVCRDGSGYEFSYDADRGQIYWIVYLLDINEAMAAVKKQENGLKGHGVKQRWAVLEK